MPPDADCVVVGAGLVGCATAVALSRCGFRVTLIEKSRVDTAPDPDLDPDMRGLVLSPSSVRILRDLDLWAGIAESAHPVKQIRVTDQGALFGVDLDADELDLDALGYACHASRLLQNLRAAVLDDDAITLQDEARFDSVEAGPSGCDVTITDRGGRKTLTCRLLVGADGVASSVRGALEVQAAVTDYAQTAIVCNVRAERQREHTAFEHFTREGPLALIPMGADRYVSVQVLAHAAAADALALSDPDYTAMLAARSGHRLGRFDAPASRFSYPLTASRAAHVHAARALLVGDAANRVHPNAAQGLNLGLRDVAALSRVLKGQGDPGTDAVVARYAALRAPDHDRVHRLTDALARGFRSRSPVVTCARRSLMNVVGWLAPARQRFALSASGLFELERMDGALRDAA